MIKCNIEYKKNIKKDGCDYFYSPGLQLAQSIAGDKENYKISFVERWLSADIYVQRIIRQASLFNPIKYGDKINIATIIYDIDLDRMIYNISENIQHDSDNFRLNFEIVKALRESDCIQIKTIERDVRHKAWITYTISKQKLQESLYRIEPSIYGDCVIVPKIAFKRVVGSLVKNKKRSKK